MKILSIMVHRVVLWTDKPVTQPLRSKTDRELFKTQMVHNSPDRHGYQHCKNSHEMQGDQKHDKKQEKRMHKRFKGVESERCPGGWVARSMMTTVSPAIEPGVMKHAMRDIKISILQNQNKEITPKHIQQIAIVKAPVNSAIAMRIQLHCCAHCNRKNPSRYH